MIPYFQKPKSLRHFLLTELATRFVARKGDDWGKVIHVNGDPYLLRLHLIPRIGPFRVMLHYFFRGDQDRELHNHPWRWSLSWILQGGYMEQRRRPTSQGGWEVFTRYVKPGRFNFIRANDYHRVDLLKENGCWTLFLVWDRMQDWQFWSPQTGDYTPWREFVDKSNLELQPT